MRITSVEPVVLRLPAVDTSRADGTQDAFLVRIHTDEGLVGIGEADTSPYLARCVLEMPSPHPIARGLSELLVGEEPLAIGRLWKRLYDGSSYCGCSGVALHVISAVDIARWDLAGQAAGQPISTLLGGARVAALPVYASEVMPDSADGVRRLAEAAAAGGYTAFKLGWGPLGRDLRRDATLIEAARAALGPERLLMIDGGQAYTVKRAAELLGCVEAAELYWLEEPLAPDDYDGYRRLADAVATRVAAGEADSTIGPFRRLAVDGRRTCSSPTSHAAAASPSRGRSPSSHASAGWRSCRTASRPASSLPRRCTSRPHSTHRRCPSSPSRSPRSPAACSGRRSTSTMGG